MDIEKMFDLSGRVALVTGSSRGIGLGIALALAKAGAKLVFHGSAPSAKLDQAVAAAKALGAEAVGVTADLGDSAAVARLAQEATAAFGQLDILVQNASVQDYVTIEKFTDAEFDREYHCNLRSTFELIQALLPDMEARGWGRVLTIGSVNQMKPAARLTIYSSTKSAMVNLVLNLARNHSAKGVTFNNIAPGVILTDRNAKVLSDEEFSAKIMASIPAGRFGQVEDCAPLALLLCSEAGSYISGADIPVAGGMQL